MNTLIIFCLFFLSIIFLLTKSKVSLFKIIILLSLLLYISLISLDQYSRFRLETEMINFDKNKDGFYSEDEITPEFLQLQKKLINDTGSNLFILIGYPICLLYIIITALLFKFFRFIYKKIRNN